ncbi:hypothetical protein DL98DRAFT_554516 [Cadophora sp. DSE1049]|nr:hypothetical protein DL98DRAFT_554516 [Cadophora sp. DSE1049]
MISRSAEQLETLPNSSIVIPFIRDTDFVERAILDQIYEKCAVLGSRTALVGLGGVGKSQLAIEYAYRTRDRSPETWVFWAHASNAARFEQSFRDIADRVKIPGRQSPTANIFQLVHDWLCDEKNGKWALILDNVDDAGFLVEARRTGHDGQTNGIESGNLRPLVSYFPQCQNGTILITTRTKVAALQLVEDSSLIAVDLMDKVDAVTLLEKKLRMQEDSDTDGKNCDISELAAAMEYMPLAIFRKSDREKTSLLDNKAGHLRRDREAKNSIIITWHISFEHVRQSRPSAADLLSLMSLFDRQGILEWLVHRNESRERDEESNGPGNEFENDLLVLRNYAFISVSEIQSAFEMHALVQLAMRTWLEAKGDLERWRRHYCKILSNEFPTGEYENWERCQVLFPHVQSAVAQQPEDQDVLRDWATIQYRAGWYAWRIGSTSEAEKLLQSSLLVRRRIFGQEHTGTIYSMMLLGHVYKAGGQWEEAELLDIQAEKLEVQVMETSKTKLGVDHPFTLTSMANLAFTWKGKGKEIEAVRLMEDCVRFQKRVLGLDHPYSISSCRALNTWKAELDIVLSI